MRVETAPPPAPGHAEVAYTVSVKFQFNVTPLIARQKVNAYLLTHVGHMLSADEPTLLLNNGAFWKIPIFCAYPEFKRREYLGDLLMNAESGEIVLSNSSFKTATEIEARADAVYHSLAAPATRV
ncbi:MAG: hypothetical protein HY260_06300 [Chloroflexi bacterium]|nr:hypothetical protein [Chloroflexota bacterium]